MVLSVMSDSDCAHQDPVDLFTRGYGGFGYDTSHVPPNESTPQLTGLAERGNLAGIRCIVESAAAVSPDEKHRVLNCARRWTEVEYRMSGFTKEYEWFDITPLTVAARRGHHDVVQFLLEEGADPTLSGCPTADVHIVALKSAKTFLGRAMHELDPDVTGRARRCVDLLEIANLFWEEARYSSSHYSKEKRAKFDNRPTDKDALLLALAEVPHIVDYPSSCIEEEDLDGVREKYGLLKCDSCRKTKKIACFPENQTKVGVAAECTACVCKRKKQVRMIECSRGVSDAPAGGLRSFLANKRGEGFQLDATSKQTVSSGDTCQVNPNVSDKFGTCPSASTTPTSTTSTTTAVLFETGGTKSPLSLQPDVTFNLGSNTFKPAARTLVAVKTAVKPPTPVTQPRRVAKISNAYRRAAKTDAAKPGTDTNTVFVFGKSAANSPPPLQPVAPFQLGSNLITPTIKTPEATFTFGTDSVVSKKIGPGQAAAKANANAVRPATATDTVFVFGRRAVKSLPSLQPAPSLSGSNPITPTTEIPKAAFTFGTGNVASKNIGPDQVAIESALSLLESLPTTSLARYCGRLQKLAHVTQELSGASIIQEVFDNNVLLELILGYEGSVAYYHKNYDCIVGYLNPLPYDWTDINHTRPGHGSESPGTGGLKHRAGNRSNLLVCKNWKSLIVGSHGLARWKSESMNKVFEKVSIAKRAAKDATLSWTARICALAIADDAGALKATFKNPNDTSRGIGAALAEQMDDDFEPIKLGHPFRRHCLWDLVESDDERMYTFTTSIAYAAALVGSVKALCFIESLEPNLPLWDRWFDDKGNGLVSSLVLAACANPTLDCIVASISTILSKCQNGHPLHSRHHGGNGNHLHLAAARGHPGLVETLIKGGMCPNRSCERIVSGYYSDYGEYCSYSDEDSNYSFDSGESNQRFRDPRDQGVSDHPLPIHWARVRGHEGIVSLIHRLSGHDDRANERGHAKFFNRERGFGFIKGEKGGKDIFVHISNIDNGEALEEGDYVEFTVGNRPEECKRLKSRESMFKQ